MQRTIVTLLVFISASVQAQNVPRSVYADSTLGWVKVYQYKGAKKPIQIDHHYYSIPQLSICDSLINWIQLSYTPVAGLGDARVVVNEKLSPYNQGTASMPHSYGAYAKVYLDLKRGVNGKLTIYDNSAYYWNIRVNGNIGDEIQLISTPEQYYFYIPAFDQSYNDPEFQLKAKQSLDLSNNPSIKNYIWYFQPSGINIWHRMVVILARNNQLPYVQVTKGEYIDQMSAAIDRKYVEEKEEAMKSWSEGQARSKALEAAEARYQKRKSIIVDQKEKYKARLQEKTSIFTSQPSAFVEQYGDLFEGNDPEHARKIPVYKYDPSMMELCKTDHPQWITINWDIIPTYDIDGSKNNYSYTAMKYMHESILNHFNFDFVYQFFFDPEKVKGKQYKPR